MAFATLAILSIYRDDIRLKTEQIIDKQVNAMVIFDDMSIDVFKDFPNLTITLHNLIVTGQGPLANDTLAIVDELDMEIKTSSLMFGDATELKSVYLHTPQVFLKVFKDGRNNYEIFQTDSAKSSSSKGDSTFVNIALDQVTMDDGRVEYKDMAHDAYVLMNHISHTGQGDFEKDIFDFKTETDVGEFSLEYGEVKYFSKKEVSVDMIMEMNLLKNTFTLKENNIRINHFVFEMDGDFSILKTGLDIGLNFGTKATEFKNIISLVPGIFMEDMKQISTEGALAFNGFVNGFYSFSSGEVPALTANILVTDAMFKIDSLPDPIENIKMELVISNLYGVKDSTVFDLKNFQFDMRKHPVRGRVMVKGYQSFKVDADIIADIDLSELERMYPIKGLDLAGKVDFELKAKGPFAMGENLQQLPFFHLNMKLKNGRVKYDHLPAAIDSIQFHLVADHSTGNLEATVFDFREIHLMLDKNRVHGFMRMEGFENIKLKSDIEANLDLADIEKMFPMEDIVMKGDVALDAELEGIYNSSLKKFPSVDAKVELKDGFLQTKGYPEPISDIHLSGEVMNATGNFADTRLSIHKLTYTLEDEPFSVSGTISDLDKYDFDLKIKGLIDFEKLTRIYPIPSVKLSGTIDSDLEARGSLADAEAGHYERISSNGTIEIKDLLIQNPSIPNLILINDALLTFSPSIIVLEKLKARLGRSTVSLTGDLSNYMAFATRTDDLIKADLMLTCDTLDLNEWLSETLTQRSDSSSGHQINVWQIPINLEAVFDSEIGYVIYEDMKMSHLDGEIKMSRGVMTLHETGFNSLNAKFNLSGDYDTRDMKHPVFDMDLDVKELDINKAYKEVKLVRDLLPAAGDAQGKFSVVYKLQGELNSDFSPKMETLFGGGEMRIANAKINGMKIFEELSKVSKKKEVNDPHLKDFVMRSEIKDNKIYIKPFSIKVSGFDADIEGISEITGAIQYLVKLELPPIGIKIPFHVTGTYSNPKVAIGKGHTLPTEEVPNAIKQ